MALSHSPQIVRDGLVLYLDAANIKSYPGSGTTWSDLKGSNNSTLQNGVTFSSDNKGHFIFDGINDYTQINIPTSIGSVCFWYYYPGSGSNKMIMGNSSSFLFQGGSAGYIHWYNLTGDYSFGGWGTGFNQAGWIYITLTYSSNLDNKFYVNESLRKSSTSYNLNKGDGVYYVAGGYYNPQNCKFGLIKTYNRELTIQEIKQNFNATRGRYGI